MALGFRFSANNPNVRRPAAPVQPQQRPPTQQQRIGAPAPAPQAANVRDPGGNAIDPRSLGNNAAGLALANQQAMMRQQQYGNAPQTPQIAPGLGGGFGMPQQGGATVSAHAIGGASGQIQYGQTLGTRSDPIYPGDPRYAAAFAQAGGGGGGAQPGGGTTGPGFLSMTPQQQLQSGAVQQNALSGGGWQSLPPGMGAMPPQGGGGVPGPNDYSGGFGWQNRTPQGMGAKPWQYTNEAMKYLPSLGGLYDQFNNPANTYAPMIPGAQGTIGGYMGGQGQFDPSQNPYAGFGMQYLNNMPGLPQAPQIGGAPTSYQGPQAPSFQGPSYDTLNFGSVDPSQIAGPNMSAIRDPNQMWAGPDNDYSALQNQIGAAGNVPTVGRDQISGSNFQGSQLFGNPNAVSTQAFGAGLGAMKDLASSGGFDMDALNKSLAESEEAGYAAARRGAMENVGGRGFVPDAGSSGFGAAYAEYSAPVLKDITARRNEAMLQAAGQQQQGRIAGAQGLTGLGSSASEAAARYGGMLQDESQFLGSAAIQQRSQDVTQRGQTLDAQQNTARNLLDLNAQRTQDYQAQTQRMTGMNNLMLEADKARQAGDINSYNALTNRLQTEYGYSTDQARNQIAGYQAATQRGEVGQQAWAESQRLGFDYAQLQQQYDQLAANNSNLRDKNLIDIMNISGNQANDRLQTVLSSMGDYAQTMQQGQIENLRNTYQRAALAADIMGDYTQANQYWMESITNAVGQDREVFLRMWEDWIGDRQAGKGNRFNWGGVISGALAGAGAAAGG